jgi:Spy/CpxP family protein refolding chaperone
MIRIALLALTLLLGAGATLEGQNRPARDGAGRGQEQGAIDMLLELRGQLALTTEQVARLQQIDARIDEKNRPLVEQMSQIRRQMRGLGPQQNHTAQQRAQHEALMEEARPILQQIMANNRSGMDEVGGVLTPPQRTRLAELIRDRVNHERNGSGQRVPRPGN